ncbi:hypothetical protein D3C78_550360 [compost metagenome]
MRIPGFGLLQLLFGRRVAEITVQQCLEKLRQTLSVAIGVHHQTIVGIRRETDAPDCGLITELIQRNSREIVIQGEHHLIFRTVHGLGVAQYHAHVCFGFAGKITTWGVHHAQRRLVNNQLRMRIFFRRCDQREIIRNVRIQFRQLEINVIRLFLPVSECLLTDFVDLIRRINKIRFFIMWLIRADIPDTGVLRGHHRQTRFYCISIIAIGNINGIQSMFYRNAEHGICQPFNVVHITRDGGITEVEIQHVRQFVKVAFIHALFA